MKVVCPLCGKEVKLKYKRYFTLSSAPGIAGWKGEHYCSRWLKRQVDTSEARIVAAYDYANVEERIKKFKDWQDTLPKKKEKTI